MATRDGTPIWYELMTGAPGPAQDFYAGVMGWTFEAGPDGAERDYRTIRAGGTAIGGVMRAPEGASFAPVWAVYFAVSDVDAAAERVRALGGRLHMAPRDLPGIGRFACVADPQGATFYLMRDDSGEDSTAFAPEKAGHCSWNELVTSDQDAALAFYGALFGWTKTGAMPMGELGEYSFLGNGGDPIGAMMTAPDHDAAPFWNFAFTVPDIDAAAAAVAHGGGTILHGPMELPGDAGDWMIQARDPEGAKAMFTGRRMT